MNKISSDANDVHRVVIIGGGFGGLYAALSLKKAPVDVTLIDRRNFHLFQPLLYQVATGALSPADIATPLRRILKKQKNTRVILGEAVDIDPDRRLVLLTDGSVEYDTLIVATGSTHHYFGNDHWGKLAPGLKTIEDDTEIRRRILTAYETAERESDPEKIKKWLTFVVIGGGPTGVELAGAMGEISRDTLRHDFRQIDPSEATILLVEAGRYILSSYPEKLSLKAREGLKKLGVAVRTGSLVSDIGPDYVILRSGELEEKVMTHTVIWAAGVAGSPIGGILTRNAEATADKRGSLIVNPDLSLPGHPEILIIGDMASFSHQDGKPLQGVAPVSMQEGRYVADLVKSRLRGKSLKPFRYRDHGSMATIGRARAVAQIGWLQFDGYLGWLAWLFVHLMYIVEFESRILVLVQWAWNYFTGNRSARLITGNQKIPNPATPNDRPHPPEDDETKTRKDKVSW